MRRYDIFISYASEDLEEIAAPLKEALAARGLKVWFDERMRPGDTIPGSISEGLRHSSYGVVILSQAYMEKYWTRQELEGFMVREEIEGNLIIPIWHKVEHRQVIAFNPLLASRKALQSSKASIEEMSNQIVKVVQSPRESPPESKTEERNKQRVPARQPRPVGGVKETNDQVEKVAPPPRESPLDSKAGGRNKRRVSTRKARQSPIAKLKSPEIHKPQFASSNEFFGSRGSRYTISAEELDRLLQSPPESLYFYGHTDLSLENAKLLARWRGNKLYIDSFWDITPEVLDALFVWRGESLTLGLQELSAEIAACISRWKGERLEILSLDCLEPEAAEQFAAWPGKQLVFTSLRELPSNSAKVISSWKGRELTFRQSRGRLTPAAAAELSTWGGETLTLDWSLDSAAAESLAKWKGRYLDLEGIKSLSTATAEAFYHWTGDELRLGKRLRLSKGALHYLNQWSEESEYGLGEENGVWWRCASSREPEPFGFFAALRMIRTGIAINPPSLPDSSQKPRATGELGRRRIAESWRSFVRSIIYEACFFIVIALLLAWLLRSPWSVWLAGVLRVPSTLEPVLWRGTLQVLSFLARLLLILVSIVVIAGLGVLFCVFSPKWAEIVEDKVLVRRYEVRWDVFWIGGNVIVSSFVLWCAMRTFFPGFLSLESVWRAVVPNRVAEPALTADGFWHGFLNLPRAVLVKFPPHALIVNGWFLYLCAYLLGLIASVFALNLLLRLPLALLTGFDSDKFNYVEKRSNHGEILMRVHLCYLGWCLVLLVMAIIAMITG